MNEIFILKGGIMTENEMKKRMKEIDKERKELKAERQEYEKYFSDKKKKEELNNRIKFEGKCFSIKNLSSSEHKHIQAFEILKVLSEPDEMYAECVVVVDGRRSRCRNKLGVQIMNLPLWEPDTSRLMSKASDPKMIDMYKEITQEDFNSIYEKYRQEIESKVF